MSKDFPDPDHMRHKPPPGLGEMRCEVCEHWTTRHAHIKGKKNVHFCTICKQECVFPDIHYESGTVFDPK